LFKKAFSFILSGILLSALLGPQTADAKTFDAARQAAEARAKVQKIGTGADARVEVKLRDDSKVKGYVTASDEETFSVTDSKTGESRKIYYTAVSKVSKSGGSSTRKKILIGAAVAAGVVVGIIFAREALCDGGAQDRGIC
jgi:preprotein translocase subunit SecF